MMCDRKPLPSGLTYVITSPQSEMMTGGSGLLCTVGKLSTRRTMVMPATTVVYTANKHHALSS